jgi:activator of HSP90 ATPase
MPQLLSKVITVLYGANILVKQNKTVIKQKVVIPATPDEVYEAFMDAKVHSKFTGSKATVNPKVGGKFTAWDGYISGKNLELEKGKRIVQEWVSTDFPEGSPPSKFELTFRKVDKGTEITMVHSNFPVGQAEELEEGWTEWYWKPLKDYFKKQKPQT